MQRHAYDFLVVGSSIERTYWHDLLQFAEVRALSCLLHRIGIHQCDDATVHDATVHDATVHDATAHDATVHTATERHKLLRLGDAQRPAHWEYYSTPAARWPAHCVLSD